MPSDKTMTSKESATPPLKPASRPLSVMLTREEIESLRQDTIKADKILDKAFADLRPARKKD